MLSPDIPEAYHELWAVQYEEFARAGVPDDLVHHAYELGGLAVLNHRSSNTARSADAYGYLTDVLNLSDPSLSDGVIKGLVESGMLTEADVKNIRLLSAPIMDLYNTPALLSAVTAIGYDDDVTYGVKEIRSNAFIEQLLWDKRIEHSEPPNVTVRTLIAKCYQVNEGNSTYFLESTNLERIAVNSDYISRTLNALLYSPDGYPTGRLDIPVDMNAARTVLKQYAPDKLPNLELLTMLGIADLLRLIDQLPEEIVKRYVTIDGAKTDVDNKAYILAGIMASRDAIDRDPHRMKLRIFKEYILDEEGTLSPENEALWQQIMSVGDKWEMLRGLRKNAKIIATRLNLFAEDERERLQGYVTESTSRLSTYTKELIERTKKFAEEDPSPERVLGALSIENWLEIVRTQILKPRVSRMVGLPDNVLHRAIQDEIQRRQESERTARCAVLIKVLSNFDLSNLVTNQYLRGKDALGTVREISEWQDNGSQRPIFDKTSVRLLVGLAYKLKDNPAQLKDFVSQITEAESAWSELGRIQQVHSKGSELLTALFTLRELHESGYPKLHKNDLLKELAIKLSTFHDAADSAQDVSALHIAEIFKTTEPIEAFPPGTSSKNIREDFKKFTEASKEKHSVEWERIDSLLILQTELEQLGLEVTAFRLIETPWHYLPHYVLEVQGPKGRIAIVESPIKGHATYVIANDEWRLIVQFDRTVARDDFGAVPKYHAAGSTPFDHREKLINTIRGKL